MGKKKIAVGDSQGKIRLLKIENDRIEEIGAFDTRQGKIESMDWNYNFYPNRPDRYLLATTGTIDNDLKIWAIDTMTDRSIEPELVYQKDWSLSNLSLRFSHDGQNLLIGSEKGRVVLIKNIENLPQQPIGSQLKLPQEIESKVTIGFGSDDRSFTIVSHEGKIWRSNLEPKLMDDNPIVTYQAGTENIAISSKNSEIATGGAGAALRIWDLQGHQIADYRGYWGTIRSINFSKDGKYLLAGGDDGIPRVWQIDRDIPTLIKQGCQWLEAGYFESHAVAKPTTEIQTNSTLADACRR